MTLVKAGLARPLWRLLLAGGAFDGFNSWSLSGGLESSHRCWCWSGADAGAVLVLCWFWCYLSGSQPATWFLHASGSTDTLFCCWHAEEKAASQIIQAHPDGISGVWGLVQRSW
jgi:hypothetical protein